MVRTRNYPALIGAGVAVLLFSLVGAAAVSGVMPQDIAAHNPLASPLVESTASAVAAKKMDCRTCGVIAAIRPLELRSDGASAGASSGAEKRHVYRITVQMDDGSERALSMNTAPLFGVGTRVRVRGTQIERGSP